MNDASTGRSHGAGEGFAEGAMADELGADTTGEVHTADTIGAAMGGSSETAPPAMDNAAKVREKVREAGNLAAQTVETQANKQKHRAAGSLGDLAHSLRTAGGQLPRDNSMGLYMVRTADRVDNLAGFLDRQDIGDLVDEVEAFARRQPAAFLGGAFALGVLGARFLKSSRTGSIEERYREGWISQADVGGSSGSTETAVDSPISIEPVERPIGEGPGRETPMGGPLHHRADSDDGTESYR